ncbi:origin recognition complex subunit 4 [Exaiptasia diaphana]|uniref:Origin recognition complex subunit 4 n=1 Tax=Exaiptasia diaphana TaxID=2652724 RepID=A0A913WRP0_EXADI|nr:origin recognition complex subunit 4 [Exaiptasia diaphana]KXJ27989.1 Origin recognition complex subunit 4 [Exaiptasia diaphana]
MLMSRKKAKNIPTPPEPDKISSEDVHEAVNVIRSRLFKGEPPEELHGLSESISQLKSLLSRCAEYGESNSVLLVGPRGSGKTLVLQTVLKDVCKLKTVKDNILKVYLNGLVHTDDRLAMLDITRQLKLENVVGDRVFGSSAENLAFLLDSLKSGGHESQSILFVLDEFDLFVHHKNQTLLYNLFDVSQSAQTPICVIGLTCRLDVVELLEKRVKSRFSHRQIHLFNSSSFGEYLEIVRSVLSLPSTFPNKKFQKTWNDELEALIESSEAQEVLRQQFNITKDIRSLHNLLILPVCSLNIDHPFLTPADIQKSRKDHCIDHKQTMLHGLSVLELCLIIAMKHLLTTFQGDPFNFEMIFKEYKRFTQRSGHSAQSFDKDVVFKAFEHLLALELIKPVDGAWKHVQKEYRLVTLLLSTNQIMEAIDNYPECPTDVRHWATSNLE